VALDRDNGRLRLEVEGRGREAFHGQTGSVFDPFQYDVEANDGWSVTANAWRDYFLGERWGAYVGGGLGGDGYRLFVSDDVATGSGPAGGFAWQAGGGLIWDVTDRMTLDLGYRWFAIDTVSTPLALSDGAPAGAYTSAFGAGELLLAVRVYEPFRRWMR
jgi:opacity protein-like surface antigen